MTFYVSFKFLTGNQSSQLSKPDLVQIVIWQQSWTNGLQDPAVQSVSSKSNVQDIRGYSCLEPEVACVVIGTSS
jgi:hypothetical protein